MAIIYESGDQNSIQIAVWKMEESLEFFENNTTLNPLEQSEVDELSEKLKPQWLACRHCLFTMLPPFDRPVCLKDQYGKPFLKPSSSYISMSHSHEMAAVSVSTIKNGIDIQKKTAKVDRIKSKFMHPQELLDWHKNSDDISLHVYWGAKESIYKAYGMKRISFARDIRIRPFQPAKSGSTVGNLCTPFLFQSFSVEWDVIDDYVLVYVVELEIP